MNQLHLAHRPVGDRTITLALAVGLGFLACTAPGSAQSLQPTVFVTDDGNLEGAVVSLRIHEDGSLVFVQRLVLGATGSIATPAAGTNAAVIDCSPNGRWLLVGHGNADAPLHQLSLVEVHADATLSLTATFDMPGRPRDLRWIGADLVAVAVVETGATHFGSVRTYAIETSAPSLQPIASTLPTLTLSSALSLASTADARRLVVADAGSELIYSFEVESDGELLLLGSYNTAPFGTHRPALSPDEAFLYGAGADSGSGSDLHAFTFDSETGVIAPLPFSPIAVPDEAPQRIVISDDGSCAAILHDSHLRMSTRDLGTGAIAATAVTVDAPPDLGLGDFALQDSCLFVTDRGPPRGIADWHAVPRIVAREPQRWVDLLARAETEMVRLAVLGDSQETSPGGAGNRLIPRLNEQLWLRAGGHVGESILMSNTSVGGGAPPAGFLWRGGLASPNGPPTALPLSQRLPNIAVRRHRAKSSATQAYGSLSMLLFDGSLSGSPGLPLREYFRVGVDIKAEVFVVTSPGSGDVSWNCRPRATNTQSYFNPAITGSGTLLMNADHDGPPELRSAMTPTLVIPKGTPYVQVEVWGSSLTQTTEVLGLRFVDVEARRGFVAQSISAGGYQSRHLIENHGDSGYMLRGLGFTCAVLGYGANDASNNVAPAVFRARTIDNIQWIRDAMEDPEFPVILMGDPHRKDFSTSQQFRLDSQPAILAEIAEGDPDVVFVNMRRITFEDFGWGPDNEDFLADVVHLTPAGAQTFADSFVDALFSIGDLDSRPSLPGVRSFTVDANGELVPNGATVAIGGDAPHAIRLWTPKPSRHGDLNGDGVVDGIDLGLLLAAWGSADPNADLNGDGTVDSSDLGLLLVNWS